MGFFDSVIDAVTYSTPDEKEYVKRKKNASDASSKLTSLIDGDPQGYLLGSFGKLVDSSNKGYKNILYHLPEGGSATSAIISQLANPEVISEFLNATPSMLGILTPRIEFYKVINNKNGDGKTTTEELLFSDHVSGERMLEMAKVRGGISADDEILKRTKLATDIGVKEFTWMFDNKHSGDKTIKASLSVFFGSILELANNDEWYSFIFNSNTAPDQVKNEYDHAAVLKVLKERFDFMKSKKPDAYKEEAKKERSKAFRQIKVRIGWSRPSRTTGVLANMNETQLKRFYDSVEATQKVILLNLTQYKLNFGQEGQVELQIDYVGSLDSILVDPDKSNIFTRTNDDLSKQNVNVPRASSYNEGMVSSLVPFYKSLDPTNALKDKAYGFAPKRGTIGRQADLQGHLAKQLELEPVKTRFMSPGFQTNVNALEYEKATLEMAQQYLKELGLKDSEKNQKQLKQVTKGLSGVEQALAQINNILAQEKFSQFYKAFFNSGKLRYATIQEKKGNIIVEKGGTLSADSISQSDLEMVAATRKKFEASMEEKRKRDAGIEEEPKADKEKRDSKTPTSVSKDGKFKILYVTVGDILEIASTDEKGDRFPIYENLGCNILLGGFNARGIFSTDSANYSIADIPISMETFGAWFLENFTGGNPPSVKISFRNFLNKVMNGLVAPVINQYVADQGEKGPPKINFSMATISYPRSAPKLRKPGRGGKVLTKDLKALADSAIVPPDPKMPTESYFTVFATISDKKNLKGDPRMDINKGILHLKLGSDRGIVKTYAFSEKKMPQLRAMNIENASGGSSLILPQDVELTMVGNTFFRNGSLLYINAGFALGDKLASKIGVGGYYVVVKVENTINASRFETRLTCMRQHGPGEG